MLAHPYVDRFSLILVIEILNYLLQIMLDLHFKRVPEGILGSFGLLGSSGAPTGVPRRIKAFHGTSGGFQRGFQEIKGAFRKGSRHFKTFYCFR